MRVSEILFYYDRLIMKYEMNTTISCPFCIYSNQSCTSDIMSISIEACANQYPVNENSSCHYFPSKIARSNTKRLIEIACLIGIYSTYEDVEVTYDIWKEVIIEFAKQMKYPNPFKK